MTASRSEGAMATHPAISAPVRPQPTQKPATGSSEQTRMQGDRISAIHFHMGHSEGMRKAEALIAAHENSALRRACASRWPLHEAAGAVMPSQDFNRMDFHERFRNAL